MAGSSRNKEVAKRVIDELKELNGKSEPNESIKVFTRQQIVDARNFIQDVRPQVEIARNQLGQLNALLAEFRGGSEPGDVFGTWISLRDDQVEAADKLKDLEYWVKKAHETIELKTKHLGDGDESDGDENDG